MKRITTTLAAIMLLTSPVLASTFYRWVDDNGVTHYSEQAPQGRASEPVRTWGQASSDQRQAIEALDASREARAEARQEAGEQAASAQPVPQPPAAYCAQHRANLEVLTNRPVVRRTDPETGEQVSLDADQREAMIRETQEALRACP